MAGITQQGFVTKRLADILAEQRAAAVQLFQDLVPVGDTVDTSPSSTLGRLIALDAAGDADLWEVAQQAWSAFDPNSATGISLDNLVQYSGISRFEQSQATVSGLFAGDNGTLITGGSVVKSVDGNSFEVVGSVALSPTVAAGATLSITSVQNSTLYSFSYTTGITGTNTVSFTSGGSATTASILAGLLAASVSHPLLAVSIVGTTLVINRVDVFQASTFTVSTNLAITAIRKIGQLIAVAYGKLAQEANTITTISTPILGWSSVTNPLPASGGRLTETDEELRIRFRNTKLERSSNILDSLYSALLNLSDVEELSIYENDTDVTDSNGVLPHSFLPVILGGSSQLIADTIWQNKPMGIRSQGNTIILVTDSQGFQHNIGFERPSPVTVYMIINLSLDSESPTPFPGDGVEQIQSNIKTYAKLNFGVGRDVIYNQLFTPINQVAGHQIDSMFIGTSPAPTGVLRIPIAFNELSSFESVNISVVIS